MKRWGRRIARLVYLTPTALVRGVQLLPGGAIAVWTSVGRVWRSIAKVAAVVMGLALFLGAEYTLACAILHWDRLWYLVIMAGVTIVAAVFAIRTTVLAYSIWLVMLPWTWYYPIRSAHFYFSFDILALTLISAVVFLRSLGRRRPPRRLHGPELLLVLSILIVSVRPIVEMWIGLGRFGFTLFGYLWQLLLVPAVVYFVVRSLLETRRHVVVLLYALVAIGVVWTISGFYEHFSGYQWHSVLTGKAVPLVWRDIGNGRAIGPADSQVVPGTVLSVGVLALLHLAAMARRFSSRALCYLVAAAAVVAIFFTYTRTSYGGFCVALVALLVLARGRRFGYGMVTAILAVAVLAAAPALLQSSQFRVRMLSPDNYYGRKAMSLTALNVVRDHFWLGAGSLKEEGLIGRYVSSRYHPREHGTNRWMFPDNDYLVIFAQSGVFGFLIYYGAIIGFMLFLFRIRSRLDPNHILGQNLASTTIGYSVVVLVAAAFTQLRSQPYLHYLLFTMFAMTVRAWEIQEEEADSTQNIGASHTMDEASDGLVLTGSLV